MKKILLALMLLSGLPLMAQKYELVWKENFNGNEINQENWTRISRNPGGNPDWLVHMSTHDALYDVEKGKLVLRALVNDGVDPSDSSPYLTGGVFTKGKKNVTLGKIEVKAKLPGCKSLWPAIWMLPENGPWPDAGEIDIMEHLNHDDFVYQTVHTRYTYTLGNNDNPPHSCKAQIKPDRYNVYGVEILEDCLKFYVNGKHTLTYPRVEGVEADKKQFPFGTPYYLLIDMQIGGSWVGPAEATDLPAEMYVDWVKFYEPR